LKDHDKVKTAYTKPARSSTSCTEDPTADHQDHQAEGKSNHVQPSAAAIPRPSTPSWLSSASLAAHSSNWKVIASVPALHLRAPDNHSPAGHLARESGARGAAPQPEPAQDVQSCLVPPDGRLPRRFHSLELDI